MLTPLLIMLLSQYQPGTVEYPANQSASWNTATPGHLYSEGFMPSPLSTSDGTLLLDTRSLIVPTPVTNLCTLLQPGELGSPYYCIQPDGTAMDGGVAMYLYGDIAVGDLKLCPGGQGCVTTTGMALGRSVTDSSIWAYVPSVQPTGSFTTCAWVHISYPNSNNAVITQYGGPNGNTLRLNFDGVDPERRGISFRVDTTIGSFTAYGPGMEIYVGAWHIACGEYDSITDGTSTLTAYIDGVPGTPVINAGKTRTNGWGGAHSMFYGAFSGDAIGDVRSFGGFWTEVGIGTTRIQDINRTALARSVMDATGKNEFASIRASQRFCGANYIPPNVACRANGTATVEPPARNVIRASRTLEGWGATTGILDTVQNVIAADQTLTAREFTIEPSSDAGDLHFISQGVGEFAASCYGITCACGVYLSGVDAGGSTDLCIGSPADPTYDNYTTRCTTCFLTPNVYSYCAVSGTYAGISTGSSCMIGTIPNVSGNMHSRTRLRASLAMGIYGSNLSSPMVWPSGYGFAASASRPSETSTFTPIHPSTQAPRCMFADVSVADQNMGTVIFGTAGNDAGSLTLARGDTFEQSYTVGTTVQTFDYFDAGTSVHRAGIRVKGTTASTYWDNVKTSTFTASPPTNLTSFSYLFADAGVNYTVSNVVVGTSDSICPGGGSFQGDGGVRLLPKDGLLYYWAFDDATTNDSMNLADGLASNTYYDAGILGRGLVGLGDGSMHVWMNNNLASTSVWSMQAWVRPSTVGSDQTIILGGTTSPRFFLQSSTGKACIYTGSVNSCSATGVSVGVWTHVIASYDGSRLVWFINGAYDSNAVVSMSSSFNITQLGNTDSVNQYFNGTIDELAIWTRPLLLNDAITLYNSGMGLSFTGIGATPTVNAPTLLSSLLTYYPLEGDATDVVDGGHNGTVNGSPAFSNAYGKVNKGVYFDGTVAKYISVTAPETSGVPWAVSFWVNLLTIPAPNFPTMVGDTITNGPYFVYDGNFTKYYLYSPASGQNYYSSVTTANNSGWHHLVYTYDGSSLNYWIDGSLVYHNSAVGGLIGSAIIKRIGNNNAALLVNGYEDEIGLWGRRFTSRDVNALYNNGSGVTYPF